MSGQPAGPELSQVVDRRSTPRGELVLRRCGPDFEIISNGIFLMDTRDGRSERLLVDAALSARPGPARVLIGGLGVGVSLADALAHPRVTGVTVVEVEPAVIEWQRGPLRGFSGGGFADPRVQVVCADLLIWVAAVQEHFDVICLDIDNGPQWTAMDSNASLYTDAGLRLAARRLAAGGCVTVWSSAADSAFEARLERVFGSVQCFEVAVPRGEPDVVYLAMSEGQAGSSKPRENAASRSWRE